MGNQLGLNGVRLHFETFKRNKQNTQTSAQNVPLPRDQQQLNTHIHRSESDENGH